MDNQQGNKQELITENHFFRELDCMLAKSPDWQVRMKGYATNGMGDLIYRTAIFAIILQDTELMLRCIQLLNEYKRWPDHLEPGKKKRRELRKAGYKSIRSQRSMTRDPYIMTFCAIALMEELSDEQKREWIKKIRLPFWMNRLWLNRFRATLLNPDNLPKLEKSLLRDIARRQRQQPWRLVWIEKKEKHKREGNRFRLYIYGTMAKILGHPGYVKFLQASMAYVTGAKEVQEALWRVTPHWNYGILLLTEKPTMYMAKDFIEKYQAKEGFQWAGDKLIPHKDTSKHLPDSEKYKMDKDLLDYLWRESIKRKLL